MEQAIADALADGETLLAFLNNPGIERRLDAARTAAILGYPEAGDLVAEAVAAVTSIFPALGS